MFGLLLLAMAGVVACFNLTRVINYIAQICESRNTNTPYR